MTTCRDALLSRLYLLILCALIGCTSLFAENVPQSGSASVTTCSTTIYDCGGASGDYSSNCSGYLVINPSSSTSLISITGGTYNVESSFDKIYVYDGVGTGGTQLAVFTGSGTITTPIVSNTGALTIRFTSDGSVQRSGFAFNVSCTAAPTPVVMSATSITTCSARWTDPGGNSNYSNNQDVTQTICSDNGNQLQVNFLSFALSSGDYLYVYDGNTTGASLIGTYTGSTLPGTLLSSGTCLTFRFVSNASGVNAGWVALITCRTCVQASVANGSPCANDGANPFCTDENPYGITYASGTTGNADVFFGTSHVGCLYSVPRPAFYYMRIDTPGDLLIHIEQHNSSGGGMDVDFACWGPFTASDQNAFLSNLCCNFYNLNINTSNGSHCPSGGNHSGNMGGYPDGNLVDCSYSAASTEWCFIPNAQIGQYYILLITNYNGNVGTISFNTVAASTTASTDCSLLAQVVNGGPYCEGDHIQLTCQNPQSGASYSWTGPNGWTSNQQNPQLPNATTAMSGDYTLVMTVGNQASTPATTTVVVNANPVAHITTSLDTVCTGQHATLTATGGSMYAWSTGNGGSSINVSPQTSGYYYVTATSAGNCHDTVSIYLTAAPTKTTTLHDTICPGTEYQRYGFSLTTSETADAQNRTLQQHLATTMGCDSTVTLYLRYYPQPSYEFSETRCDSFVWNNVTYNHSGDFQQHFTSMFGCDSTVTLHLTIHQSLQTEFSVTQCDNYQWNSQTYTQSGDYVQHFQTVHGCDSTVTLHLTINPVVTSQFSTTACVQYLWADSIYTATGDYVRHFLTPAGCDSTVTMHLTIHPAIQNEWTTEACDHYTWNNVTYDTTGSYMQNFLTVHGCDSMVTLHLTIHNRTATDFDTIGCNTLAWQNHTYTQSGAYTQNFQTVHGCDSVVTMHLTIDELAVAVAHRQPEHCGHADGSVELNANLYVGTVLYDWNAIPTGHDNVADNLSAGQYSVAVTDSTCSLDFEFSIQEAPLPEACFTVVPGVSSVPKGTELHFVNCSQDAQSWHWSFGDGNASTERNPSCVYDQVGVYTISLIVTDEFGCQDSTSRDVNVREEMTIFFPNAITPNGDGLNDEFKPFGTEIAEEGYSLYIYNKWGELVFHTTCLQQGWNGTFKEKKVMSGSMFTYIVQYQNFEGRPFVRKGTIVVL